MLHNYVQWSCANIGLDSSPISRVLIIDIFVLTAMQENRSKTQKFHITIMMETIAPVDAHTTKE